jgi:glycosyltransferase involved in cell wall biosynthesis
VLAAEGEAAELISRAEAGFVVPPENPAALASAIRNLLSDADASRAMGLNGRAYIQNNLEWSLLVRNWLFQLTGQPDPTAASRHAAKPEYSRERIPNVRAAV